jgi:arylsulfatase A-like enzyme
LDGQDIRSLIGTDAEPTSRQFYFELEKSTALRDGNWKYLQPAQGPALLFDLASDPNESTNHLAEQPQRAATMRQQLETLKRVYATR